MSSSCSLLTARQKLAAAAPPWRPIFCRPAPGSRHLHSGIFHPKPKGRDEMTFPLPLQEEMPWQSPRLSGNSCVWGSCQRFRRTAVPIVPFAVCRLQFFRYWADPLVRLSRPGRRLLTQGRARFIHQVAKHLKQLRPREKRYFEAGLPQMPCTCPPVETSTYLLPRVNKTYPASDRRQVGTFPLAHPSAMLREKASRAHSRGNAQRWGLPSRCEGRPQRWTLAVATLSGHSTDEPARGAKLSLRSQPGERVWGSGAGATSLRAK